MSKHIEQLSVFIENKTGELKNIIDLISKQDINIKSIMVADSTDFSILRIICDDTKSAANILNSRGASCTIAEVLGVKIKDFTGSFAQVVGLLCDNGYNIKYTYTVNEIGDGIFVFKLEDNELQSAKNLLNAKGIEVIGQEDL